MRKSILTISIIPILSVLLMTGCKKDKSPLPPTPQNPVEEPGDGFMQATIDGETIVIKEAVDQVSGTVFGKIEGTNNNVLSVLAHADLINNNYRQISFTLTDDQPIKEGTYDVIYREDDAIEGLLSQDQLRLFVQWKNEKGQDVSGFLISSTSNSGAYPEAQVTITKFTNKSGEYIEGTFQVKDAIGGIKSKSVSLADGKFRARLD